MRNTVLFGIDPQNCFGHPDGGLYVENGFEVVGPGNLLMNFARAYCSAIFLSADWHPPDSDHFRPIGPWPPHGIAGTWDAEFLAPLNIPNGSFVFRKGTKKNEHGYDPFEGKDYLGRSPEEVLGKPTETTIITWGIATNYCVRAFVLTARRKGYGVYVVLDACRAVPTPDNPPLDFVTEEQAIEEMKAAGAIMTTVEEVINGRI